jgi:hypothetical protein
MCPCRAGGVVLQYATTASGTVVASDGSVKGSAAGMDKLAPGKKGSHADHSKITQRNLASSLML